MNESDTTTMSGLRLTDIKKSFGKIDVIHDVNLTVKDREFVVFVGPSGCGKSTLLRLVAGLEEATSGSIEIGGNNVTRIDPAERGVAMVFQSYALYPHMTVAQNMGFGLKMTGFPKNDIEQRVARAAEILHLEELLDRKPKQLSGGQRQRVAIGRAIVREPKVFLFDEPLSNLDAELRVQMRLELAKLHKDLGATMIYVTHDQVEAMTLADKIVVLRNGRVEQIGSPLSLYEDPDNMFVAGFIGSPRMNFLRATVVDVSGNNLSVRLTDFNDAVVKLSLNASGLKPNQEVSLGIRPEHFDANGQISIKADIEMIERLGGTSYAYARSNAASAPLMTIDIDNNPSVEAGKRMEFRFDPEKSMVFDSVSQARVR